jgi:hypothetical protein
VWNGTNWTRMKSDVHLRLDKDDRALLEELKKATGHSESELLRLGLHLVAKEQRRKPSALDRAGRSVGRFKKGPKDLATNKKHLEGFGE